MHVYIFMDVTCILEDSPLNISYTVNFACVEVLRDSILRTKVMYIHIIC